MKTQGKQSKVTPPWYRRLGCLLPLAIVLVPFMFVSYIIFNVWYEQNRPTYYAVGSEFKVDDLPESAHDVRYCPSVPFAPLGITYEFKCSEEDYRIWVARLRTEYDHLSDIRAEERGECLFIAKDGSIESRHIGEHLISDWTYSDQGFYLIYDLEARRAVRWSHSR